MSRYIDADNAIERLGAYLMTDAQIEYGGLASEDIEEWKPIEGATNAPKGMRWWGNGESRFGGNYRHELRPEPQPISEGADETQADARYQNGLGSLRNRGVG